MQVGRLKSGSTSTADKIGAIGTTLTTVGSNLTKTVTLPLTALGTAAVATFTGFDDAMLQVKATMNASADDMQLLTETARQMGIETRYSASEAAQALNYMALAGYDAETATA